MAYEDFTTYTEVDENGDITVVANLCTVVDMRRDACSYVISPDKGVGHFGDFVHLVDTTYTDGSDSAFIGFWALTNQAVSTIAAMGINDDGIILWWYRTNVNQIRIVGQCMSADNSDDYIYGAGAHTAYCTIERNGTTFTCDIYDDAARTTWRDTITFVCENGTKRYVCSIAGADSTLGDRIMSMSSGNLCGTGLAICGEEDVSAGIKIWDGSGYIELVEDNTSPVKIYTGSETIGVKLVNTNDPDASAIHIFDGTNIKAFKKL